MAVTINGSNTPTAGGVTYGDGTTYANTAAGAAGGVLYSAGSSAPAFTAAGSAGQVLTSAGASAPTWAAPSAGAMVLLSTLTASSSATLTYSGFSTTYDVYVVVVSNLVPSIDGVDIRCSPYTVANGVETNQKNAYYNISDVTEAVNLGGTNGQTGIGWNVSNTSTYNGISGTIYFSVKKGTSGYMPFWYQTVFTNSSSLNLGMFTGGSRPTVSRDYEGFRITASSGNLASGNVRIYGLVNS